MLPSQLNSSCLQPVMAHPASLDQSSAKPETVPSRGTTSISDSNDGLGHLNGGTPESSVSLHGPALVPVHDESNTNQNPNDIAPQNPWTSKTVLTLDGGGVKGYSSLLILRELMNTIKRLETMEMEPLTNRSVDPLPQRTRRLPQLPKIPTSKTMAPQGVLLDAQARSSFFPAHYFDYIGGTSTGGLIAIMLGRLGMTVEECLKAYETLTDGIFGHARRWHVRSLLWMPRDKYNYKLLEKAIKQIVKEFDCSRDSEARFPQSCADMCRTVVVAWQKINVKGIRVPYLFRSYVHPRSRIGNALERNPEAEDNYPIWKVARATSAAPTYLKAVKMKPDDEESEFIDGGFGANNPSEEICRSVAQLHNNQPGAIGELVSIGTGKPTQGGSNPKRGVKLYYWLVRAALKLATESEETHERMCEPRDTLTNYSRLNVEEGLGKVKLDTWKGLKGDKTLKLLRTRTEKYLSSEDVRLEIRQVAERLIRIRRSRAGLPNSDHWERFCHGVEYKCCVHGCSHGERMSRDQFRQHLLDEHPEKNTGNDEERFTQLLKQSKDYRLFEADGY